MACNMNETMNEYHRILLHGYPTVMRRAGEELIADDGRRIAIDDAVYLPPTTPRKIICVHLNYRSRVEEYMTRLPATPTYFHKPVTALCAHRAQVVRPRRCEWLNYEGEIAVVIGRRCRNVARADVGAYIAGYTIANDFGLHDFRDTDAGSMLRVKGADTLCPVGPALVTDWDFSDKSIRTLVNGTVKQDGNTREMQWDMHYLVADIARTITLEPGDLLLTGTPANSRPVQPGDTVTVEVEGLGELTNTIVDGAAVGEEVGHQPATTEEVVSTAMGGEWEFRGIRAPKGPGAKHYQSAVEE